MFGWLRRKTEELFGSVRSGRWRSWRAAHLKREPDCRACGSTEDLEVHHITPVHAGGPELAPPEGLITLCRPCHHVIAHACDWYAWRPDVRRLAAELRAADVKRASPTPPQ